MRILPIQQASLWESVCHQCLAVDQCGGAETAPCRCVRSGDQYKQCDTCPLVCRDRRLHDEHGEVIDSFALRLREGLPLQLLRLTHVRDLRLPPLMLSRTESFPEGLSVPDGWVAVHLRTLVPRLRMDAGPTNSETAFRHRLRVRPTAKLVAVMNGNDDLLERLWSLPRRALFTRLRAIGIRILTGPSFSVYGENGQHPASSNVAMLLRHHRFCADAAAAGLTVLPNLYWRSANDLAEWATWLRRNPTIVTVSRDFSRTKQRAGFVPELRGLIEILRQVSRPMTVVVSGVGEEKMTSVVRAFRDVSASASFVTARPVIAPPSATNGDLTSPCRAATVQARIDEFKSLATGEGKTAGSRLN